MECLAAEGWKIESTRTVTESNCYDNEETIKFEATDGEFLNEALNVWFSHLMKELSNFVLKYIGCLACVPVHYTTTKLF